MTKIKQMQKKTARDERRDKIRHTENEQNGNNFSLSVITLNVNWLSISIKGHGLAEWMTNKVQPDAVYKTLILD